MMCRRRNSWRLGLAWLAVSVSAVHALGQAGGAVLVETNLPDAVVRVDSLVMGPVALGPFHLEPGSYGLTLVPPEGDSWTLSRPTTRILVTAGETTRVSLPFPYVYRLESRPYGAAVSLARPEAESFLGTTPVLLRREIPLEGEVVFRKEGYRSRRIAPPSDDVYAVIEVALEPEPGVDLARTAERQLQATRNRWIDVAAAGWAVASGVIAVRNKARADDLYDRYALTGDPGLRPRIRTYDTRSAVALGSMQVGIGVLAFRLIF